MPSLLPLVTGLLLASVAAAQDLSKIPPECIGLGLSMQKECSAFMTEAQTFFKLQTGQTPRPGSITQAQIQAYMSTAKPPTPGCCKVACQFNNAFCSCEKAVVDFAASMAGSVELLNLAGKAFASSCKFQAYIYAESCPARAARPTTPKALCSARRLYTRRLYR